MLKTLARGLVAAILCTFGLVALAPSAVAATGSIQGTVTALGTGTAADAWVFVYSAAPQTDVFTDPCADDNCVGFARTDGAGAFTVSGLAVGSYKVFIQSNDPALNSRWYGGRGDAYVTALSVAAPNGSATTISPRLTIKGGISGTVSDDAGDGSGVTVTAYRVNGDGTQNPTGKNATTARDGTYQIPSLAAGNYRVVATDAAHVTLWNGGAASFDAAPNVAVADGATVSGINFMLTRYGSITGTVTDSTGAPAVGVTVEAHVGGEVLDPGTVASTTTGANGTYTIGSLAPGIYRVRAGTVWTGNADYYPGATDIAVASGSATGGIDFTLPGQPGSISGTITPALPGTIVGAYRFPAWDHVPPVASTTVDASGNYSLTLPAGNYYLRVDPPASRPDLARTYFYQYCDFGCWYSTFDHYPDFWEPTSSIKVEAGAEVGGLSLSLIKVPVIAGQITDSNGEPVANASVQLWLRGSNNLYGEDACANDYYGYLSPKPCLTASTDTDGRYVLHPPTWPDAYWFPDENYLVLVVPTDGLHQPRWLGATSDAALSDDWPATADTHSGEWQDLPGYGNAPEVINADQVLNGAGRFTGTLTSSTGGPAAGVAVRVHANVDDGSAFVGRNYKTTSAADGSWSVGNLPPGGYTVYFDGSDHFAPQVYNAGVGVAVSAYQTRPGIDGVLLGGGRIAGTITGDSGTGPKPIAGAKVHAFVSDGAEVASAVAGSDGGYHLNLGLGTYRLFIEPPSGATYAARWFGQNATSQATADDLTVTLGTTDTADAQLTYTGPVASALTISAGSGQIAAGKSTTVAGVLSDSHTVGIAGVTLTLEAKAAGANAFQPVGTATTTSSGAVSIAVDPTVSTTYRWVFAGDANYLTSTSPTTQVEVAFTPSVKAVKRTLSHRSTATIWGKVTPARAGSTVVLQELIKGTWRNSKTTTVKKQRLPGSSHSTLGYLLKFKRTKGTHTFRVVVNADPSNLQGTSSRVKIKFT